MVIRRSDGYGCLAKLPPDLEKSLAVLDTECVVKNAAAILAAVYEVLPTCTFELGAVSTEFLEDGYNPTIPGALRHIPSEVAARSMGHEPTWRHMGYAVDVGDVDLDRVEKSTLIH